MTSTAAQVLDVARRNIGVVEGKNNSNPYAPIAGHANNQPWCASFVVACARKAAGGGVKLGSESAYTPNLAQSMGASKRAPKIGDIMFMYMPSMGRIAHTGIVESVGNGFVITIEGNTDEAGGRTGGKVMRKKRALSNLSFATPNYAAPKVAPPKPAPAKPPARKPDPVLRQGNRGQLVLNVQNALVKHGIKVARDSDFGPATKKAVIAFQKKKGLVADGVVGQATWNALRSAP